MSNPFDGIISAQLKSLYNYSIDEILRGLSVTCRLIYGDTIFTDCPNCIIDVASSKSANKYKSGGPISFTEGMICPYCDGAGMIGTESTEDVSLAVVWNYKNNMNLPVNFPNGSILTISPASLTSKLKQCKEIVLDTSLENIERHLFIRDGEPQPAGLGSHDYVFVNWKRK